MKFFIFLSLFFLVGCGEFTPAFKTTSMPVPAPQCTTMRVQQILLNGAHPNCHGVLSEVIYDTGYYGQLCNTHVGQTVSICN